MGTASRPSSAGGAVRYCRGPLVHEPVEYRTQLYELGMRTALIDPALALVIAGMRSEHPE